MIKAILFDLDGTLLPMDQEKFTKAYFSLLAKKVAPLGYNPSDLVQNIWAGTKAMTLNDGIVSNEKCFWLKFSELMGSRANDDRSVFDDYYSNEFNLAKEACGFNELAKKAVDKAKSLGFRVALATNPIFPAVATESRIKWAGCSPDDFEFYTTYENSGFSKPNPLYYRFVSESLGVNPEDCLMVGNDVAEDLPAKETGMSVFLLTDCIINKNNDDISSYPHGGFEELIGYLEEIRAQ